MLWIWNPSIQIRYWGTNYVLAVVPAWTLEINNPLALDVLTVGRNLLFVIMP